MSDEHEKNMSAEKERLRSISAFNTQVESAPGPTFHNFPRDLDGVVLMGASGRAAKSFEDVPDNVMVFIHRPETQPEGPYVTQKKQGKLFLVSTDVVYEASEPDGTTEYVRCILKPVINHISPLFFKTA